MHCIFRVCSKLQNKQSILLLASFFFYLSLFVLIIYYNTYEKGSVQTPGFPTFILYFYNTYEKGGAGPSRRNTLARELADKIRERAKSESGQDTLTTSWSELGAALLIIKKKKKKKKAYCAKFSSKKKKECEGNFIVHMF